MRQRQIAVRAHLGQPRRRPDEFRGLDPVLRLIEMIRIGCRRSDQFHRVVVERVDQIDETLGFIAVVIGHNRNVIDDDGMEFMGQPQIIRGAEIG